MSEKPGREYKAVRFPAHTYERLIKEASMANQSIMAFEGALLMAWSKLSIQDKARAILAAGKWNQANK